MWQQQTHKSSLRESIKALETDIQHANALAAKLPRDIDKDYVQMKLDLSPFAPFLLFLIEWMDYSCLDTLPTSLGLFHILVYRVYLDGMPTNSSCERRATLREFYAVIYPSLQQLESNLMELEKKSYTTNFFENPERKEPDEKRNSFEDLEGDEECGICMEAGSKVVLPNCGHSMCSSCFYDWNARSQSCPFCRGSLKRMKSGDLWIVISNYDVVDTISLTKENLSNFYLYINKLPTLVQDSNSVLDNYYML